MKSALLGTRHPRKEKEAALQNVTGEPACQYGKIRMITQSEMEPSIKIKELKSVAHNRRGRQSTGPRKACCRVPPPIGERPIYPTSNDLPNLPQGGGGTCIHTDTYIPRLLTTEKQAQSGSPKMRNPTVETPTNRGQRVKRCPNESRAYMYKPSFPDLYIVSL